MTNEKIYNDFFNLMKSNIRAKQYLYKDTWKTMPILYLEKRLTNKFKEFKLTNNPNKLISITNLSMFLYLRKQNLII